MCVARKCPSYLSQVACIFPLLIPFHPQTLSSPLLACLKIPYELWPGKKVPRIWRKMELLLMDLITFPQLRRQSLEKLSELWQQGLFGNWQWKEELFLRSNSIPASFASDPSSLELTFTNRSDSLSDRVISPLVSYFSSTFFFCFLNKIRFKITWILYLITKLRQPAFMGYNVMFLYKCCMIKSS